MPITGTSRTPRSTRPTSAGKVSSLARSPVAPKIASASTGSAWPAWSVLMSASWFSAAPCISRAGRGPSGGGWHHLRAALNSVAFVPAARELRRGGAAAQAPGASAEASFHRGFGGALAVARQEDGFGVGAVHEGLAGGEVGAGRALVVGGFGIDIEVLADHVGHVGAEPAAGFGLGLGRALLASSRRRRRCRLRRVAVAVAGSGRALAPGQPTGAVRSGPSPTCQGSSRRPARRVPRGPSPGA